MPKPKRMSKAASRRKNNFLTGFKRSRRSFGRRPQFIKLGLLAVVVLAVAVGIFLAASPRGGANPQASAGTKDCSYGTRCYFWANINKDIAYNVINWRIAHGMPVYPNIADCESNAAFYWSQVMASQNRLFHSDLATLFNHFCGVRWAKLGEVVENGGGGPGGLGSCLAYDIVTCPKQIVSYWENSPEHNAILLDPAFNTMGFGTYQAPNGIFWVTGEFSQVY